MADSYSRAADLAKVCVTLYLDKRKDDVLTLLGGLGRRMAIATALLTVDELDNEERRLFIDMVANRILHGDR